MANTQKFRYWWAVLYTENMLPDWEDSLADSVQLPFAYCLHDRDLKSDGDADKPHVHLILAWDNTTSYNNALSVFQSLTAPSAVGSCCNTCKNIINMRSAYNYLIHDTDECRKKHKFEYPAERRIEGNGFQISLYETVSLADKMAIRRELSEFVLDNNILNYAQLYANVITTFADNQLYEEVMINYSAHFERLCRGNFLSYKGHEDK